MKLLKELNVTIERKFNYEDVKKNKDTLYVYSENIARKGSKGELSIRDLPNACPLYLKVLPCNHGKCYMYDTCGEHYTKFKKSLTKLVGLALEGKHIVLPAYNMGKKYSKLNEYAPRMYEELITTLQMLNKDYVKGTKI